MQTTTLARPRQRKARVLKPATGKVRVWRGIRLKKTNSKSPTQRKEPSSIALASPSKSLMAFCI